MAHLHLFLLAIILSTTGFVSVQACENQCRKDPVVFLSMKYNTLLQYQANTLMTDAAKAQGMALIPRVLYKLQSGNHVIESTIFSKFRGSCVKAGEGLRSPDELCGSAKSIACFAPWDHRESVFDSVHVAAVKVIRETYAEQSSQVQAAMVDGVDEYCPDNCQNWVVPFQDLMLAWEQREHSDRYKRMPNCLALDQGGI